MFKKIFQIGCMTVCISMMSLPIWADNGMDHSSSGTYTLARYGHGPGDGTGNGGSGPHDGTGHGSRSGDCLFPDADMTNHPFTISRGGNGGGGNGGGGNGGNGGGGNGSGDGTGNGGSGPQDGSGNGSKSGTCINS